MQPGSYSLHIHGPDLDLDFQIPPGATFIGRDPACSLSLSNTLVSRRHAELRCSVSTAGEMTCTLTDLDSANGTYLDGKKLVPQAPVALVNGAHLRIGPYEIHFILQPLDAASSATSEQSAGSAPVDETPQQGSPPIPPPPPTSPALSLPSSIAGIPPGLSQESLRLLKFLPPLYHTAFMSRFLALFESILLPIEWTLDSFDLYLDPASAPGGFLPWLEDWYIIVHSPDWSEPQRRVFLQEAHRLYARRGTPWAMRRVLEIYLGSPPEIIEFSNGTGGSSPDPFEFTVKLPFTPGQVNQELLEQLISANKPAHTRFRLEYSP